MNATLQNLVDAWFTPRFLEKLSGRESSSADAIGREWLLADGKRLRPLLTASVYDALAGADAAERIAPAAVAVECFHKASLVHDDIEDGDTERYGRPAVHVRYGVAQAINAGDWLLGEGYRLLAASPFDAGIRASMLAVAAEGHRELARGQGDELAYCAKPQRVSVDDVLRIYRRKTASAFEVAAQCGAVAGGLPTQDRERLSAFSRAFGVAYQIRDDQEDFTANGQRGADLLSLRPTLHFAEACRLSLPETEDVLQENGGRETRIRLLEAIAASEIPALVQSRLDTAIEEAKQAAGEIRVPALRDFLFRCASGLRLQTKQT